MTKSAVQTAYRTCAFAVCTGMLASAGYGDAFEDWKTRCLYPMQDSGTVDVSGLSETNDGVILNGVMSYELASGAKLIVETKLGPPTFCNVSTLGDQALTLRDAADAWMDTATAAGHFQEVPDARSYRTVRRSDGGLTATLNQFDVQGTIGLQVQSQ